MTIDTQTFPPQSLTLRGRVEVTEVDGLAPEHAAAARRYLGEEAAAGMLADLYQPGTVQARIALRPAWVGLLDFVTRLRRAGRCPVSTVVAALAISAGAYITGPAPPPARHRAAVAGPGAAGP